jgi:hypothetical protein
VCSISTLPIWLPTAIRITRKSLEIGQYRNRVVRGTENGKRDEYDYFDLDKRAADGGGIGGVASLGV